MVLHGDALTTLLIIGVGLVAGVAGGLFGVGGGVVMVPAVVFLLGADFLTAKAASLLVIVVGAAAGVARHHRHASVDWSLGVVLGVAGVGGAVTAVLVAETLSESTLRGLFGIVLILAAVRLMFEVRRASAPLPRRRLLFMAAPLGVGAGVLAGLFGIGGGILMVPVMVLVGVPIHLAVGTSLVAVWVNAVAATGVHVSLGYLPSLLAVGVPLAIGQVPGARLGADLAHRLPARTLRLAFAGFLALMGLRFAADLI